MFCYIVNTVVKNAVKLPQSIKSGVYYRCISVRKNMTLSGQKFKMCCAHMLDAAAVCAKLKAISKLTAICLCLQTSGKGLLKFSGE
jgi:hypothetical protein